MIKRETGANIFGYVVYTLHDDVIKWKHFPRNWPFVRGIHRSPLDFPKKGQWRGALIISHYDVTVMDKFFLILAFIGEIHLGEETTNSN